MIWQKNVKNDYLFLLHWQQMVPARPPNSSLEITKSVGIHVSVSCWKKVVPLHLHWTYNIYIYIYYNLKGGPKINQSTAHFQLELPFVKLCRLNASPCRRYLPRSLKLGRIEWPLYSFNIQIAHLFPARKRCNMQVLKKKRKMKPFEVHKEIPTPLLFATCTSATILWNQKTLVYVATVRVFELATVVSPLRPTVPVPVRNWPVPLQKGGVVGHGKDMLMLWGKSGCQSFNTWPISQMTWTLLEIQITSALSFFIKSRRHHLTSIQEQKPLPCISKQVACWPFLTNKDWSLRNSNSNPEAPVLSIRKSLLIATDVSPLIVTCPVPVLILGSGETEWKPLIGMDDSSGMPQVHKWMNLHCLKCWNPFDNILYASKSMRPCSLSPPISMLRPSLKFG